MPTLGELANQGKLHRVARFLRQELTPLDFERAPEAFEARLEDLLHQAIEVAGANNDESNKKFEIRNSKFETNLKDQNLKLTTAERSQDTPHSLRKSPATDTRATSEVVPAPISPIADRRSPPSRGESRLFRWVAESVASDSHKDRNEDRWLTLPKAEMAAVLDGVGGNAAAASQWVTQTLEKEVGDMVESGKKVTDWPAALKQLLLTLNQTFISAADQDKSLAGGSTTLALATIVPTDASPTSQLTHPLPMRRGNTSEVAPADHGSKQLAYASVGDSRITVWHKAANRYELTVLDDQLLRLLLAPPDRRPSWLQPLLTKHGLDANLKVTANEAATAATLLDRDPDPTKTGGLTKFLFDERAIVTQVLGAPTVNPHVGTLLVSPGDRVLLATDGIHDNLTEPELVSILAQTEFSEVASALVVRAQEVAQSNAPRAKRDDMTAVVLEIL